MVRWEEVTRGGEGMDSRRGRGGGGERGMGGRRMVRVGSKVSFRGGDGGGDVGVALAAAVGGGGARRLE